MTATHWIKLHCTHHCHGAFPTPLFLHVLHCTQPAPRYHQLLLYLHYRYHHHRPEQPIKPFAPNKTISPNHRAALHPMPVITACSQFGQIFWADHAGYPKGSKYVRYNTIEIKNNNIHLFTSVIAYLCAYTVWAVFGWWNPSGTSLSCSLTQGIITSGSRTREHPMTLDRALTDERA